MKILKRLSSNFLYLIGFSLLVACVNSEAHIFLEEGKKSFLDGNFEEAIANFDQAIEADNDLEDGYFYRGRIYLEMQDCGKALGDFDAALALNSEESVYHAYRGAASLCNNAYDEAIQSLSTALEAVDDNYIIYFYRGLGYSRQSIGNALQDFSDASDLNADFSDVYIAKAIYYLEEKNFAMGMEAADLAIDLDDGRAVFYAVRAALNQFDSNNFEFAGDGIYDEGEFSLDTAFSLQLTSDGVGSFRQALADWEKAIELEESENGLSDLYNAYAEFTRELLNAYDSTNGDIIFNQEVARIISIQENDFDRLVVNQPLENMYDLGMLEIDSSSQQ